jgi:NAD(P)-dependent dehydrogenase (short-subunit alcohol dehydrogenase family)
LALADFDVSGKRVLITGAGRGIGKGIALAMAEAGCDVGVTALGEVNAAKVAAEVRALGRRGFGWACDATKLAPMQALAEKVMAEMGGIDVLINCVGDAIRGVLADMPESSGHVVSEQDWHTVIDINLTMAYTGCHAFGPYLLKTPGASVINISSFAAIRPAANMVAYAAAKAGLTRFTESLALEWAPNVRVNAIAPGTFPDPEQQTPEQRARGEQAAAGVPLKRLGLLREVGLACIYLASPAAAYITGANLAIDGGRTLL